MADEEHEWLVQHQGSELASKIAGTISQIQTDQLSRKSDMAPMQATRNDYGEMAVNATKRLYSLVVKAAGDYTGMDALQAQNVLKVFNEEYKEYLPYLV